MPFSGSLQYGNATRLQADDGSDRGHARGLIRWAEVPVGSGDLRRRASSARGPSSTSFGVLGLTRARQSILAIQQGRLAQRRPEWSRSFCGARHTPALHSHTCARARDTQVWRRLRRERQTRASRQEQGSQGRAMQTKQTSTATRRRELPRDWQRLRGRIDLSVPTHWQRPTTCYYRGTGSACAARLIPACSSTSVTRRRLASRFSVEQAPMSPLFLSPNPPYRVRARAY
jgi:hypothetical protein